MLNAYSSNPIVTNCTFRHNSAGFNGGGVFNFDNSSPTVAGCTFTNNAAHARGGGMYNWWYSSPTVTRCTFTGNSADRGGGLYGTAPCSPTVNNCILWGNTASSGGHEIALADFSTIKVAYCDVQGGQAGIYDDGSGNTITWEIGNIDADPLFADPNSGDVHLRSQAGRWDPNTAGWINDPVTSRCIDAGNPGSLLGDEPTDPNNLRINMGAYGGTAQASKTPAGWSLLPDLTNDGTVDLADVDAQSLYWLGAENELPGDLNRDGLVDIADLKLLTIDWLKKTVWFGT